MFYAAFTVTTVLVPVGVIRTSWSSYE